MLRNRAAVAAVGSAARCRKHTGPAVRSSSGSSAGKRQGLVRTSAWSTAMNQFMPARLTGRPEPEEGFYQPGSPLHANRRARAVCSGCRPDGSTVSS